MGNSRSKVVAHTATPDSSHAWNSLKPHINGEMYMKQSFKPLVTGL